VTGSLVTVHPDLGPLLNDRPQRAKLLDAMVRVVAEKGYEAATVADAVKLARVSRGTFYELFESKEACLAAAYRMGLDVLAARVA
jgi:AcrR family transcriptional regulator